MNSENVRPERYQRSPSTTLTMQLGTLGWGVWLWSLRIAISIRAGYRKTQVAEQVGLRPIPLTINAHSWRRNIFIATPFIVRCVRSVMARITMVLREQGVGLVGQPGCLRRRNGDYHQRYDGHLREPLTQQRSRVDSSAKVFKPTQPCKQAAAINANGLADGRLSLLDAAGKTLSQKACA